jgi:hypothetical protein
VYDGIYNGYGGRYVLYDREGNAAVVDEETMNSFSKYKGKNPLDLDRQVDYNIALDNYEHLRKQDKIKYKDPDAYYTQLKNIMDKIDNYETEIGKPYKNFRGNEKYHKSREYVSDEVKAHFDKKNVNQQQQARQTQQTQNNQNRTRINRKASEWTDEDIAHMADGDPDVYNELIKKRETARAQIKQREEEVRMKKERKRELKEDRKRRRQEQINSRKKNNINEKEYSSMWENLLNERDAATNNEEAINNLFNINSNNTGTSYSYNIPDINQKEVDSFIERVFGSKDFDLRKASQNDINYWSNFTAQDIKDIFIFPSDFSNQDTLDEISRRIDDIAEVSEAYKLTDKFMENNFGSKDFDITQDKDPSAWADLTDEDLEYAYESLLPDDNKSAREMILERLKTIRDDAQNLVNNQTSNFNSGANFNQTSSNTNTNTNSGGGSSSASGGGSSSASGGGSSGSGGASSGSGGSSNSTGGSSSSTKTHLYKRNGKMRQLSNGSSKYSANTKFKVNTNSGHLPRTSNKAVKTIGTMSALNTVFNVAGAVSDYKNARREGKGVVGATLKAGAEFALGEMLGLKGQLALFAVRAIPSAAIAGADMLYKESRRMNSAANQGLFGNAQFQDTQQLATMRQSGMEMAKMANYNLQQTLMGNEATYFHR